MLIQLMINGLVKGALIALAGLAFAIYYNTTRIFHIAFAGLYTLSCYFFFTYFQLFQNQWLPAFALTAVSIMLAGAVMEILVYQTLSRKKSSLSVILVASIGMMIVIINLIAMFYGNEVKVIVSGIADSIQLGDLIITHPQVWQFGVSLFAIVFTLIFLRITKWGKIIRAIRDDESLAMASGINIWKTRVTLIAVSSLLASLPAVLVAVDVGMDPYIGMPVLLSAVVALIIGGIGRFEGPVLGGFFLGILQALVIWKFSTKWVEAITFVILIIFLIFRPQGVLGEQKREV
jgi:branched-chain amino acid transport system permease protein